MKTVSFQGVQLTPGQRRMLDQQQRSKQFMNSVLADQVEQTLKALEVRKEQGAKPEKVWVTISQERGTPSIAEWMGY